MFFNNRRKKEIHTLLITRFSALGDVAMTVPAIYSAAKQHPEIHLLVATKPFFGRVFLNAPSNVHILSFDLNLYRGIKGLLKLISELHRLSPDAVADFHNVLRTWIIDLSFRLAFVPVAMLDKQRGNRKKLPHMEKQRPFVLRYFDVLNALQVHVKPQFVSLFDSECSPVLSIQKKVPEKGTDKWIGLAPFSRYLNKSYPFSVGGALVSALVELPNVRLFIFAGGEAEWFAVSKWTNGLHGPINLVDELSIEEQLRLMSQLDILISMDSANMHLASIAGTRVISLWGSTTSDCGFLGWNQRVDDAICLGLSCQPCTVAGSDFCKLGHYDCLNRITPAMVANKVKTVIYE